MNIFVTGAGGFVGAAVVREALNQGHTVTAVVRPGGSLGRLKAGDGGLQVLEVDLRDIPAVRQALGIARPELVIHAGWSGVSNKSRHDRTQISDNIEASCAIIEGGLDAGVRKFVGVGSQAEYGPMAHRVTERDLPQPISLYGAAKLSTLVLSRQLAARSGMSFAWMRLFSCYGPGDNGHWLVPTMIEQLLAGQVPKTTHGEQRWDYLFIDDVARGILAAGLQTDATGVFNLGSGIPVPIREVVETIRQLVDPAAPVDFGAIPYGADQVWHMEADNTRLKTATDWCPRVPLLEGLRMTVDWHKRERSLDREASTHV